MHIAHQVPALPAAFKERLHPQQRLIECLLAAGGGHNTAVAAPKSRVASQGMVKTMISTLLFIQTMISTGLPVLCIQGGVGKTMLTAAVVRDEKVRAAFSLIGWINLSQQPNLKRLQARLFQVSYRMQHIHEGITQ